MLNNFEKYLIEEVDLNSWTTHCNNLGVIRYYAFSISLIKHPKLISFSTCQSDKLCVFADGFCIIVLYKLNNPITYIKMEVLDKDLIKSLFTKIWNVKHKRKIKCSL